MTEVCNDVQFEPDLQPLTGEQLTYTTANVEDGARLDIAANGFLGGRYERTFTDVCIFNPHAPSNRNSDLATCYRKRERSKKRAYEQRVRKVEHASFTPWSCLHPVAWQGRLPTFTKTSPPSLP